VAVDANKPPPYPEIAREREWEGIVNLSIQINRSGIVTKVEILKSSGFAILDEAASNAAKNWRFNNTDPIIIKKFIQFSLD